MTNISAISNAAHVRLSPADTFRVALGGAATSLDTVAKELRAADKLVKGSVHNRAAMQEHRLRDTAGYAQHAFNAQVALGSASGTVQALTSNGRLATFMAKAGVDGLSNDVRALASDIASVTKDVEVIAKSADIVRAHAPDGISRSATSRGSWVDSSYKPTQRANAEARVTINYSPPTAHADGSVRNAVDHLLGSLETEAKLHWPRSQVHLSTESRTIPRTADAATRLADTLRRNADSFADVIFGEKSGSPATRRMEALTDAKTRRAEDFAAMNKLLDGQAELRRAIEG